MTTIKSYTDIEQSKKLAEILPLESADMDYIPVVNLNGEYSLCVNEWDNDHIIEEGWIPCWSLAALLSVLPDTINGTEGYCRLTIDKEGDAYNISYEDILSEESIILYTEYSLIDACYEMIIHLHELNLL